MYMEVEEHNYQYYEEYRRLYHTAYLLSEQLKHLAHSKEDIWTKVGRLEVISNQTYLEKDWGLQGWY